MRNIIWRQLFIYLFIFITIGANPLQKKDHDDLNNYFVGEIETPGDEYYYDYYEEPFDSTKYKQEVYLDRKLTVECEPYLQNKEIVSLSFDLHLNYLFLIEFLIRSSRLKK